MLSRGNQWLRLPLGVLLLIVALSAGSAQASALPGSGEPAAAAVSLPDAESPLPPSLLRFELPSTTLAQGLWLVAQADRPAPEVASDAPAFPPAEPDWGGLARDTGYLIGYQFVGFVILYVSPESISNWSPESKKNYDFGKWTHNVSNPSWDEDKWWINYILHPYWGSAYYLDARGRGFSRWGSFWYSVLGSSLYEFGTEAFAEEASIQDIFVTPIAGSLLGMAFETPWRYLMAKGESRNVGDSVLLYLIDPLGQLNHDMDRLFGFGSSNATVKLLPVITPVPGHGTYAGVQLSMRW